MGGKRKRVRIAPKRASPKSKPPGTSTSTVAVQGISDNGLWLLCEGKEYFLPYSRFPWFQNARVVDVFDVKLYHGFHLHWPALDVDLEVESLEDWEKFPLMYAGKK